MPPTPVVLTTAARPIRLAVVGPDGRMGAAIIALAAGDPDFEVVVQVVATAEMDGLLIDAVDPHSVDVLVDLSHRDAITGHAAWVGRTGVTWVLGTTGLTAHDQELVAAAAETAVVFQATNFSIGVALLADLSARASRLLGTATDVEIIETHHSDKVDAPSGTALTLAAAVAGARGQRLDEVLRSGRDGLVGARPQGEIGVHAIRLAGIVGRHSVHFGWPGEGLQLGHEALDRSVFARGALRAVHFAVDRASAARHGLCGMTELVAVD